MESVCRTQVRWCKPTKINAKLCGKNEVVHQYFHRNKLYNKNFDSNKCSKNNVNVETFLPLVVDLRITHERVGRSSDLSLNGNLRYPNDKDRSLNETATNKIL